MYNPNQPPPLNQAQLARARAQMPRAGWWLNNPGQQYHPDYHPQQYQRQRAEDDAWQQQFNAAQQQPPGVLPQYEPPDGPPPGYIFAHGPMQPQPLVRAPRQPQAVQVVTHIDISVPLNTGVANGLVSRVDIRLPVDISFDDAISRITARMDLDPLKCHLGYKYHDDKRRGDSHQLTDEDQWRAAIDHGIQLIRRARTRRVVLEIENLQPARQTTASKSRGTKRSADDSENDPSTSVSFVSELRQLKGHLSCARHPGSWCYVDRIKPDDHIPLDIFKLTLWAKKIFFGDATLQNPPSELSFDHVPKKRKMAASTKPNATPVQVNITNVMPFGDQSGQRRVNAPTPSGSGTSMSATTSFSDSIASAGSPTLSSSSSSPVCSCSSSSPPIPAGTPPPINNLLYDLHQAFPIYNLPQCLPNLRAAGIKTVDDVPGTTDEALEALGVSEVLIEDFRHHARLLSLIAYGDGVSTPRF
ncbi:hypothetical protein FIBSPDRAFT_889874 [Athelia psychrophila]|uniref:SAM domain-containing protein n=1 Tax=Athelia psychrophila TaxID=1759441 RepID=A0A166LI20_9AGAM|nr:hypothetical protein FIBSPDRAFT_889874 [Fibularhizoctonia sp. CBS 109695]